MNIHTQTTTCARKKIRLPAQMLMLAARQMFVHSPMYMYMSLCYVLVCVPVKSDGLYYSLYIQCGIHIEHGQAFNRRTKRSAVYARCVILCFFFHCFNWEAATLSQHFPSFMHASCMRDFVTITAFSFGSCIKLFLWNLFRRANLNWSNPQIIPLNAAKYRKNTHTVRLRIFILNRV